MCERPIEYVFFMADGSQRFEIVYESKEAFQFQAMHKATGFMPLAQWEARAKAKRTFEIFGNYGTITADYDTGEVLEYHPGVDFDSEKPQDGYGDILCIDVQEVQAVNLATFAPPYTPFDILDVGFWTKDGKYEPRARNPLTGDDE